MSDNPFPPPKQPLFDEAILIGPAPSTHPPRTVPLPPLYQDNVAAGFPAPADNIIEHKLDLQDYCIRHPFATYFVRAGGDSMIGVGIFAGDLLVVDRSLTAEDGDIIIAAIFGELTVKRLSLIPTLQLIPENPLFTPIPISPDTEWEIFGVVTHVIHSLK